MSKFNKGKASILALTAVLAVALILLVKSLTPIAASDTHSTSTPTPTPTHKPCDYDGHQDNNDHYKDKDNNGKDDGDCRKPTPSPTPTPTPKPTKNPCEDFGRDHRDGDKNKDCKTPTPAPSQTPEPTSTPTGSSDNSGSSSGSNGGNPGAPVCGAAKPGTPTILSEVRSGSSEKLTWSSVANATYYSIIYGSAPGYQYGVANVGNVTSYTVDSLNPGATYHFAVNAVNDCMPGDSSGTGGQVLGASTMAGTGSFAENLYLAIMTIGGIITTVGLKNFKKDHRLAK